MQRKVISETLIRVTQMFIAIGYCLGILHLFEKKPKKKKQIRNWNIL